MNKEVEKIQPKKNYWNLVYFAICLALMIFFIGLSDGFKFGQPPKGIPPPLFLLGQIINLVGVFFLLKWVYIGLRNIIRNIAEQRRKVKKNKPLVQAVRSGVNSNPLKKMSLKELDKRAYAELVSENYELSLHLLNELIENRARKLYKFYNMRAECYLKLNDPVSALHDALSSVELEADITKNNKGYEIRNMLTKRMYKDT
ncbi:hypothetical protein OAN33_07395 [Flavobacteriales bacterium]|nr:hypothetical protein [Flavobacteriales bacterium]